MVMHYKSLELTGFFSRSQGAERQAAGTQACRRYRGMRRGAEWQAGRRAVGGRQASICLVCAGRQQTAGLVRRSGMQSACSLRWKAWRQGRQAGGREAGRNAGGHAGLRQASERWQAVKKQTLSLKKAWAFAGK